jgi:Zn-dependent hydrolases, including glyoxylases
MQPDVRAFFDQATWTMTYVVKDPHSTACAIVDSVLDFDAASGRTTTDSADKVIAMVQSEGLDVEWILETHVHADHLSAAPYLHKALGGRIGIGAHITDVQEIFGQFIQR